jgi:hypothetical protein
MEPMRQPEEGMPRAVGAAALRLLDDVIDGAGDDLDEEARRQLAEIRCLSNVAQALENVLTQCEPSTRFETLRSFVLAELIAVHRDIRRKIHEPPF